MMPVTAGRSHFTGVRCKETDPLGNRCTKDAHHAQGDGPIRVHDASDRQFTRRWL